jgi:hypothetical protein
VSRMTLRRIFLKFLSGIVISSLAVDIAAAAEPFPGKARLNLVFILDGLRPDSINSEDTPSLFKFRQEGVNYSNGHSVPHGDPCQCYGYSDGHIPGHKRYRRQHFVRAEGQPQPGLQQR